MISMEKKNIRAAIYCRVSTEEQKVDTQEIICKEYCQRQAHTIYQVYKDVISGATAQRPELNQLLSDMRQYKFDCIVVTKLDRLGRSLQHLLSLFDEFNKRGIAFVAVTQNIDTTTSAGRLQMQIMGAFAEFERSIISERTREGLKRRKEGTRGKDKTPRVRRFFRKPMEIIKGGSIAQ